MKKGVSLFFIVLLFAHPLHANTSPKESINSISKAISKEDYVAAEKLTSKFLKEHTEDIWHFRALYLKAHIIKKLSRPNDAVEIYLKLLSKYPHLNDYILLRLAEVRLKLGEETKALDLLNQLLKEFPQSRLNSHAKSLLGKLFFDKGDSETAYKFFTDIVDNYPASDLTPESIWYLGIILKKQGKIENAYETFSKLFHSFPLNKFAMEAEEKIRKLKKTKAKLPKISPSLISKRIELLMKEREYSIVSRECKKYLKVYKEGPLFQELTFILARVYTSMRKRKEALQIYKSFITKHPSDTRRSEALYNVANIYWNQGKFNSAIEYSQKVINQFPKNTHAEKALYVIGRILEQRKKYTEAIIRFKEMTRKFPQGPFATSGHWHIGWIYYITGNYTAAAKKFAAAASVFQNSLFRDQTLYWAGKSYEKTGETAKAQSFYKKVAKEYPFDYYGHLGKAKLFNKAENKVKDINPFSRRKLETYPAIGEVDAKMNSRDSFHFKRAKELTILGYYDDAIEEIRFIARNLSVNTPEKILWVGNLYIQAGGYVRALRIIDGFLNELSSKKQLQLSMEYRKLSFPLAFRELVNENANIYKLDPFLISSLMRQESSFDPDAFSRSGAIGLMQLMPETGKSEFKKKYKSKFYEELLYSPKINISLGSQHLAHLLKHSSGDTVIALAGYNAGLSRARKWKKTLTSSDTDVFIEMIPFRETRWYLKKVLRNYFNYIMLYGNLKE